MISFGNKPVKNVFYGGKQITAIYRGNKKIWPTQNEENIDYEITIYWNEVYNRFGNGSILVESPSIGIIQYFDGTDFSFSVPSGETVQIKYVDDAGDIISTYLEYSSNNGAFESYVVNGADDYFSFTVTKDTDITILPLTYVDSTIYFDNAILSALPIGATRPILSFECNWLDEGYREYTMNLNDYDTSEELLMVHGRSEFYWDYDDRPPSYLMDVINPRIDYIDVNGGWDGWALTVEETEQWLGDLYMPSKVKIITLKV